MAKILLVDDDSLVLEYFGTAFAQAGHTVHTVTDGREVMRALRTLKIDCMVLDCVMPQVTGIEVLRKIRANEQFALLPIIMLTSRGGAEDREVAMHSRVDLYCTKNSDPDWLVYQAEELIANKVKAAPTVSDPWREELGPLRFV